jgi:hypothetical protein
MPPQVFTIKKGSYASKRVRMSPDFNGPYRWITSS